MKTQYPKKTFKLQLEGDGDGTPRKHLHQGFMLHPRNVKFFCHRKQTGSEKRLSGSEENLTGHNGTADVGDVCGSEVSVASQTGDKHH